MEHSYSHFSQEERVQIYHWHANGMSARALGKKIGRHHSSISRELARNSKATKQYKGGYEPVRAHGLAERRRRWDCRFKLERQPDLQVLVKQRLAMEQSPEQIAGRLALEKTSMRISHESIYRFIEHRIRAKDYSWHKLLPRAKFYRGRRPRKGGPPSKTFTDYVSIDDRPATVASRESFGHWEADFMCFRHSKHVMLVLHERKSRMKMVWIQPNRGAEAVRITLSDYLLGLPERLRGTITYDNGTEFAQHHLINKVTGTQSFFCHTHSPWQKGGVENAIGRMRRRLPRKTNVSEISQQQIKSITDRQNNTPRKCLAYLTPNEVWTKHLKSLTVALQP
jgi:transposase, IS30 family